ncbi:NitT/TauT family transport system substrate-binding protein [Natranaerovirga hydrolytica]|uniref:NitT/TauT family transport system substrate-binding protein n=1 Tax=Natranaerovirga hydrolytica TaxID=680378 RepID=A0A4R1MJQ4_9FIRM|nr:MqnA/MqnD/SBP family protein [Natranaerovirga hydrolytica]TCK92737.1 NitT/TauT family transport system substrate-binding protein [Natranaerovirga hydrolytica]
MRKIISLIMVITMVVTVFTGCTTNESQKEDRTKETIQDNHEVSLEDDKEEESVETITIKVAAPAGAPTLSMIKMFKEEPDFGENIEVIYETVKSPDLMASRVVSQEVDIAVVPTNLAASLYNREVNYKIAASTVWGILYVVGNEPLNEIEGLKGETIYTMGRGLTPDIILRYVLSNNGIDPDTDVNLNYMGEASELASTFIAGNSDITLIPEPALSNIMINKEDTKIVLDLQEEWSKINDSDTAYPQASLIIKNEIIEDYPEFIEAFLNEYNNSILWLEDNVEIAGEYSQALETGLSKDAVINGLSRSNIEYKSMQESKEALETYLNILFEYSPEVIGGKLPDENFYFEQ